MKTLVLNFMVYVDGQALLFRSENIYHFVEGPTNIGLCISNEGSLDFPQRDGEN